MTDTKAKLIIDQLLSKTPDSRIPKGFAALKAQGYFDGFDWEELYEKRIKPPYVPKKSQLSERPLLEGTPFSSMISKEKLKLKMPGVSKVPGWD